MATVSVAVRLVGPAPRPAQPCIPTGPTPRMSSPARAGAIQPSIHDVGDADLTRIEPRKPPIHHMAASPQPRCSHVRGVSAVRLLHGACARSRQGSRRFPHVSMWPERPQNGASSLTVIIDSDGHGRTGERRRGGAVSNCADRRTRDPRFTRTTRTDRSRCSRRSRSPASAGPDLEGQQPDRPEAEHDPFGHRVYQVVTTPSHTAG